jgi:hypothetical protein
MRREAEIALGSLPGAVNDPKRPLRFPAKSDKLPHVLTLMCVLHLHFPL